MAQSDDDFALTRVPMTARYSWWSMTVQRFGQTSSLIQIVTGSTLGFGMSFWDAALALTCGAVIIELAAIFVGVIGTREGLSSSMLVRWTGFGRGGSALIGLIIGLSLIGWFGINTEIAAQGLHSVFSVVPTWLFALTFGLLVTAIALRGIRSMAMTAYLMVPAFLLVIGWSVVSELSRHDLATLLSAAPPGPQLSLLQGTLLVAGAGVTGALIAPDMTRFNRSAADVVKQTVIGFTGGVFLMALSGVLLAHAARTADVSTVVSSSAGWLGVLVIVAGTVKLNDWNLYSAGLNVVNFISAVFDRNVPRWAVTAALGAIGSVLAAFGILSGFATFMIILGLTFPPVCGIIVAEYFVVRRWRPALEESRMRGALPAQSPNWIPATIAIWLVSALLGNMVTVGFASINALVIAFVLYIGAGKLGLLRAYGTHDTVDATVDAPPDVDPAHENVEHR